MKFVADLFVALTSPRFQRKSRKILQLAIISATLPLISHIAHADVLTWSGGAENTWDTSLLNWNGGADAWPDNSPLDTAQFSGAAATIAVSPFLEAAAFQFNSPGWTIGSSANNGSFSMDDAGGAIAINTTGTNTINSSFSNNGSPVGISISGNGTLILAGTNSTYTGNTTINTGATVQFNNDLGGQRSIFGGNGGGQGTIHLNGGTLTPAGINGSLTHNVVLDATSTLNVLDSGTLTFTGSISGAGGLIKNGSHTVSISNNDALSFQGGLTINAGTVNIAGGTADNFTGGVIVNASATLALTATNSQINASTPQALTLNGGMLTSASSSTVSPIWASLTLGAGGSNVGVGGFSNSAKKMALGNITRSAGATINFGSLPTTGTLATTTANANFAGGQQTILGGWAVANVTSSTTQWSWAVSGATGTITPLAAGAYTAFSTGDISSGASKDVDLTANNTAYTSLNTLTINSLRFSSSATAATTTLTLANPLAIATGGILLSSSPGQMGPVLITGSTLTSGNAADLIILDTSTTTKTTTIHSNITGNIGLTYNVLVNKANTLALTAANDFTGDTNISGGTLLIGNSLALQNSTLNLRLLTTSATTPAANLAFAPGITSATLGNLSGNANINLDTNATVAPVSLTVGGNNQNASYSGILSSTTGAGSLTKIGAGTLALSGANTYTGGTTLVAGTLVAASNHALGAGNVTLTGGTLELDPAVDIGTGSLSLTTGTLQFDLATDLTAAMTGSGTYALADGATVNLDLGSANSSFYNSAHDLLTFASGSIGHISIIDYDATDWIANLADNGSGTAILTFVHPSAVPEPASLALLTLGAIGLLRRRRSV